MFMSPKTYIGVSGVIFAIVAVMHALRLWRGWEILIGGWYAPAWASALAVAAAGYLAFSAFSLRRT
jgi:hypothetical protein